MMGSETGRLPEDIGTWRMKLKDGSIVQWDSKYKLEDLAELPAVTMSRLEERERCAKIAEGYGWEPGSIADGEIIAERIRSRE